MATGPVGDDPATRRDRPPELGEDVPNEIRVERTGAAVASSPGAIANTGYLVIGAHRAPARSVYFQQVRQIAPDVLTGREKELAELAAFCAGPALYTWWKAPAWAGKSALMSWSVLHPPEGVRVVSFFVTALYAGQSDRRAFLDVLVEQLAEIVSQPLPETLTEANRQAWFLQLLDEAAAVCGNRGERLVIVVDGLDEDQGADSHSIAAVLPAKPPDGVRIIVSGRPAPPVPDDVSTRHPLRDGRILRTLDPSRAALAVRETASRELRTLLRGGGIGLDAVAFTIAAGGGLTPTELAELAGAEPWEIADLLAGPAGRTFGVRGQGMVLAHEELHATALRSLSRATIASRLDRLHAWHDVYRGLGWPAETPDYLLRSYFPMLSSRGDLPRMAACASDMARLDRVLELSGGDAAGITEITTVRNLLALHPDPDLGIALALAITRARLNDRSHNVPPGLPVAWALLGYVNRAVALARFLPGPDAFHGPNVFTTSLKAAMLASPRPRSGRSDATGAELEAVALAVAETGDIGRAAEIVGTLPPDDQERLLASVVERAARAGELDTAEAIGMAIPDWYYRDIALTAVAVAAAESGDPARAQGVADACEAGFARERVLAAAVAALAKTGRITPAEALARTLTRPGERAEALAAVLEATADPHRGVTLAREIEGLIGEVTGPGGQRTSVAVALARTGRFGRAAQVVRDTADQRERMASAQTVAKAFAEAGEARLAEVLARTITDRFALEDALTAVVAATAVSGDTAGARALAREIGNEPKHEERALKTAALALAAAGDTWRAESFAHAAVAVAENLVASDDAEAVSRKLFGPPLHDALASASVAIAKAGNADRAERLLRHIPDAGLRERVLSDVARAVGGTGDLDRATALATDVLDPHLRAQVTADLAASAARAGQHGRGEYLARAAEAQYRAIAPSYEHERLLPGVAETIARAGSTDRAEVLARHVAHPVARIEALLAVAGVITDDAARARTLIDDAENLARTIGNRYLRADALASVAAASGPDRGRSPLQDAERAARSITDRSAAQDAWAAVVVAAAELGDLVSAATLAESITSPNPRARALTALAVKVAYDDPGRAASIAEGIDIAKARAQALAAVATAARSRAPGQADVILQRAEDVARELVASTQPGTVGALGGAEALVAVTEAVAGAGDLDRAEDLARSITTTAERERALAAVAGAAARTGALDRAEVLVRTLDRNGARPLGLTALAEGARAAGLLIPPSVRALLAEALARDDYWPLLRATALASPAAITENLERLSLGGI
ncbi:hypothetical protein ACFVQ9_35720 [Streptomyces goshikiensis]|uniref:hypothetical protein n=1 Tax=Streptomyces goshikiensis TaxID=1942 RepID=UPI0036B9567A